MTKDNENHHAVTLEEAEKQLADFTVIIQTTSIGLEASKNKSPISLANVKKERFVLILFIIQPKQPF